MLTYIALVVSTVVMLAVMLYCRKYCEISLVKTIIIAPILMLAGVECDHLMNYIEQGYWSGMSFYGSVLFLPIVFILVALILRVPYGRMMDMLAIAACPTLALMKLNCFLNGCCYGFVLKEYEDGLTIRFPSQIVELINGVILMFVLLHILKKGNRKGEIYPLFMIIYGTTRFILNFFRGDLRGFLWIIPQGHLWSLISVIIGIIWITVVKERRSNKDSCEVLN
ncbi:MAG: prolipoprotein diacylglyceryl transferase [Clostridiales bacterium]|nr:prolipoprotein diacylglyceryl transferase [Clostridiales bacterium]